MQCSGGVMTREYMRHRPVTVLASGPAGGVIGGAALAAVKDAPDLLCIDMGGTSYDVSVVLGEDLDRWDGRVAFRTVELRTEDDDPGTSFVFALNGRPVFEGAARPASAAAAVVAAASTTAIHSFVLTGESRQAAQDDATTRATSLRSSAPGNLLRAARAWRAQSASRSGNT